MENHIAVGEGKDVLLVPGTDDAVLSPSDHRMIARRFFQISGYRVHIVGRSSVPENTTTRELAEDYVEAVETTGAQKIVGYSLGGMIVQHLSEMVDVEKTVMVATGLRPGESGVKILENWRETSNVFQQVVKDCINRRELFYRPPAWIMDRMALGNINDFRNSVEAALEHDFQGSIETDSAVLAGMNDSIFSPEVTEELAEETDSDISFIESGHLMAYTDNGRFREELQRHLE